MRRNWHIHRLNPALQRKLAHELSLSPVVSQLLINRGITDMSTASSFLNPQLKDLHEPFRLRDMEKALERIKKAIRRSERILIFGDYDVDGLTSTALLVRALRKLGADVCVYIPHRLNDGYGLNDNAIDQACKAGASLVISVDCGTNAHGVISKLKKLKIDTVVVDHHEPSSHELPEAVFINPLRRDCSYPYKSLSAVGLAYKLTQALDKEFSIDAEEDLDLAALGTVCDVSPMTGENRIIAKHGINRLKDTKKIGLLALMEAAKLSSRKITAYHVGYILGPRLNAQGRLYSAEKSLKLLLTDSSSEAEELALTLHLDNAQRQKLEAEILRQALAKIQSEINFARDKVIVLDDERWHPGIIGIVASKIVDEYYRPTIIIAKTAGVSRGSGRSIRGFNLVEALERCREYLAGYGGHEGACGLTIEQENIPRFRESINEFAREKLLPSDLIPATEVDMEINLSELRPDVVRQAESLSPFGPGNPKPTFVSRGLKLKSGPKLMSAPAGKRPLKFWVTDDKRTFEAISFNRNLMEGLDKLGKLDIVYSPAVDAWQGETFIQLEVKDLRPASSESIEFYPRSE